MQNCGVSHSGADTRMENILTDTCRAVYNNVHIHPTGTLTPCCAWPIDVPFDRGHAQRQWESGIVPEGCAGCVAKECADPHSLRHKFNSKFAHNTHIQGVDISVDNVCNLQCLMCSSEYSHQNGHREQLFLGKRINGVAVSGNTVYKDIDWTHVKHIKLFGGEPVYSPGIQAFLLWSQDHIDWTQIHVEINTNGTLEASDELAAVLDSAAHTTVTMSVDGIESVNRVVRQGTDRVLWDYWSSFTNHLIINTAVNIYNAPTLNEFAHSVDPKWSIHWEMVSSPPPLDIRNMPEDLKVKYSKCNLPEPVCTWMNQPGADTFAHFLTLHSAYNSLYNIDLHHVNPILAQYIQTTDTKPADWNSIIGAYT